MPNFKIPTIDIEILYLKPWIPLCMDNETKFLSHLDVYGIPLHCRIITVTRE